MTAHLVPGETNKVRVPFLGLALQEDRMRHEELERLLKGRLVVDPAQAVRQMAEFRVRNDSEWSGYGMRPLEVRWEDPS